MPYNRDVGDASHVYPVTITLVADPNDNIKMLFCFNCQAEQFQYKGNVVTIAPGLPPFEPYMLRKCKNSRCPVLYSLHSIVTMSSRLLL